MPVKIVLTVLACLLLAVAGFFGFVYSGLYDVAAVHPDHPWVAWALHKTSDRAIQVRLADIKVPAGLDTPEIIRAGGRMFGENCVVCHGGPGLKPSAIAEGINPAPPNLFRPNRHPRMDEMFWFIKNGVKMTGMPGFGKTHSDEDIWALCAFLRTGPGMSPQDFADKTGIHVLASETPAGG
jgi:mono/diheme cytochrome c family protein